MCGFCDLLHSQAHLLQVTGFGKHELIEAVHTSLYGMEARGICKYQHSSKSMSMFGGHTRLGPGGSPHFGQALVCGGHHTQLWAWRPRAL